ncbi:hypothetical protein [Amycolatopsis sp. TNS106]|uniref:hypothetical protein n=1 Tax=Amycolatopsis sp. TNS106 TaxID=2861750 RepID=UPI001C58CB72|nr:hypothetical protein [Amycolatopsis sp. TNS106]QXV57341.1 hypothetical protein CVV72_10175 [Amycolatopsis sp. TNS106]
MSEEGGKQTTHGSGMHCGLRRLSSDETNWFLHHLRRQIPDLASSGHDTSSGRPSLTFASSSAISTLRLFLSRGRELHYDVVGMTDDVAAERGWWATVMAEAVRSFTADPPPSRSWVAVIGPAPDQGAAWERGVFLPARLEAPVQVGPMVLSPVPQWITQVYPHPADRSRPYPVSFWPIEVRGTVSAYYTPGAQDLAAADLGRLCLLLSLAWNQLWIHWKLPHVDEPDALSHDIDDWQREMVHCWRPEPPPPEPPIQVLDLPPWLPNAWSLLEKHVHKARSLEACQAALHDVAEGRPSAAGAQFAAMLEQLSGAPTGGDEAPKLRRRAALELLAEFFANGQAATRDDEKLAEDILMYGLRSATGHAGTRHGSERRLGMPIRMTTLDGDPPHTYGLKITVLSEVCRALLIHSLGGPLADPEPIKDRWRAITSGVLIIPGRI